MAQRIRASRAEPVWHHALAGDPGFSALLETEGEVRWYECMQCGEYYAVRWREGGYVLE